MVPVHSLHVHIVVFSPQPTAHTIYATVFAVRVCKIARVSRRTLLKIAFHTLGRGDEAWQEKIKKGPDRLCLQAENGVITGEEKIMVVVIRPHPQATSTRKRATRYPSELRLEHNHFVRSFSHSQHFTTAQEHL